MRSPWPERRECRRIVAFNQPVQRQRAGAVRAQLDALRAVNPRQRERLFIIAVEDADMATRAVVVIAGRALLQNAHVAVHPVRAEGVERRQQLHRRRAICLHSIRCPQRIPS